MTLLTDPSLSASAVDPPGRALNPSDHCGSGPTLTASVLAIYSAADGDVAAAGPRCDASGRCCRFTEYGHTLFISQLEADILLAGAPPFSGPVTRDGCPFQVDGLCTARDVRPLGCRVYFCDPAYQDEGRRISETYVRELKILADRLGTGWKYAPLHVFLNEHADPSPDEPQPPPDAPHHRMIGLPVLPPE